MPNPNQVHLLPLTRREAIRVTATAAGRDELLADLRRRAETYFGAKVELQRVQVTEEERQVPSGEWGGGSTVTKVFYRGEAWFQQRDGQQERPRA